MAVDPEDEQNQETDEEQEQGKVQDKSIKSPKEKHFLNVEIPFGLPISIDEDDDEDSSETGGEKS